MKKTLYLFALLSVILSGCKSKKEEVLDKHAGEEVKVQYTAYSNDFELFAEADPFIVGETANVLSHFSTLTDFKALESGSITIRLLIDGKETKQTLEEPTRKGIYSFDIKAETAGKGTLKFEIKRDSKTYELVVPNVCVFNTEEEAHKTIEKNALSKTNTTVFTKEQSWKIDYSSELPLREPFGQVIKTTALVESNQGDEIIVTAKTNGIVVLSTENVLEGKPVSNGQVLLYISGNDLTDNNSYVRYTEAKNNFEKAKADYKRLQELATEKIISEKELLNAKNQYDNSKVTFDNLNKNFSLTGQKVTSPISGFIKQLSIQNGQYVEVGHPIVTISQNKTLLLSAEVQQKYASLLSSIRSANIRTLHDNKTYSLEQLNGKILSYGRSTNGDNYLIPVSLQIENSGSFVSGEFVEIYLKTISNSLALTIPNTALLEEQGNFFVYVQINPELFEKREVKVGGTDGKKTEILQGISSNERIVSIGAILIKLAQSTGALDAHSGHVH